MKDEFRRVVGFGDAYSVSSCGVVMRTSPRALPINRQPGSSRSRAKPFTPSLCKAFKNRGGYYQVRIGPIGHQKTVCVHRLVAETFIPNPDNLPTVNHKDGMKTNNSVCNLEWLSHRDNVRHSIAHGLQRIRRGDEHGNAKLTAEKVLVIRSDPRTTIQIAADYGVDSSLISMVKLRKIWTHI